VQELIQIVNTYRGKLKGGPGDTNVEIKSWSLDVAKNDKEYAVGIEVDLTMTNKPRNTENSKE
jgi:hypothetical protein